MFRTTPSNASQLKTRVVNSTGCSQEVAETLLKAHNWRVDDAVNEFRRNPKAYSRSGGATVSTSKIEAFFKKYKNPERDALLEPEFEKFLGDLHITEDDLVTFVLAWKFNLDTLNQITKEQFFNGCQALEVTDMAQLQKKIPELRAILQDPKQYKQVYRFAYGYYLNHNGVELPTDYACALYEAFIQPRYPAVADFIAFLEETKKPSINRDTWNLTLEFFQEMKSDYSNFSFDQFWPLIFNSFVDWWKAKHS